MSREEVNGDVPLFETREAKGRGAYKLFATTVFVGICLIWIYRITQIPAAAAGRGGRRRYYEWGIWMGMLMAEVWFGLYWIITQSVRWNIVHRLTFKARLSLRYEDKLPPIDIFVCTADPKMEPPTLVINTVLSVMSYNYPTEKLNVYLSDDGGSEMTFYALLEASRFSKHWIPFCKKFKVEPRSPAAYFDQISDPKDTLFAQEFLAIKKLYEEMKIRIETAIDKGSISQEMKVQHKGFSEWNSNVTKQDHQSIVQIVIDGRDPNEMDVEGTRLPTLVYLSREKRPQYPHYFKAGSINTLIRVSSEISHSPIILTLDCDMYSNDSDGIRDTLCFFMDEEKGGEIAYIQHPQWHCNITKNDLYGNVAPATNKIELAGLDGYGGMVYCGTNCFHRRQSLCGMEYSKNTKWEWNSNMANKNRDRTVIELEEASKVLADCTYEKDTQWGKQMGLIYGCPVEDIVTGLTIQCRGWKCVYYNPDRSAFMGVAPITFDISLIQFKRWSEGMFQIFLSKYCPFIYGHGKIKLGAQMGYCVYLLWAPLSFPTLYYVVVPCLCLLRGIPLFPEVSSLWFLPFAYVFVARNAGSLIESVSCGATVKAWWNLQRMLLIRRTTSFAFAFVDTVIRQLGFSETTFAITDKVVDNDVLKRHGQEIMEFGSSSIMFTIMSTLAMVNLFGLVWGILLTRVVMGMAIQQFVSQIVLCWVVFMLYLPVYEALFFRHDTGRIPSSVMFKAIGTASFACLIAVC